MYKVSSIHVVYPVYLFSNADSRNNSLPLNCLGPLRVCSLMNETLAIHNLIADEFFDAKVWGGQVAKWEYSGR